MIAAYYVFMELTEYFLAVRAVVNREDPVGLLDAGAPEDEYDSEVRDLSKYRGTVTAEQVSSIFTHWFGESGTLPPGAAARIAEGTNEAQARPGPA